MGSITVALTNYNGKDHLSRLIPQLAAHGFDHVCVLDDASTDDSVAYLAKQAAITLVKGQANLGPPGNRNRILDLDTQDIILFVDADMDLTETSTAAAIEREFAENPGAGAVGALITTPDGEPLQRCWGYDFTPVRLAYTALLFEIASSHGHDANVMATVREAATGRVAVFEPFVSRDAEWVRESFFAIRTAIFRDLGGFDPNFRMFHGGPDLCRRVRQAGWAVRFTTDIRVRDLDMRSVDPRQRAVYERESGAYYYKKHYGVSDAQLQLLLR